jgi:hypothetical protein
MLKPATDVAPEPFAFPPLLIVLLAAAAVLGAVLLVVRLVRKGEK